MAKKSKNEGEAPAEGEAPIEGGEAAAEEKGPDKRFKKVTYEGQEWNRIELIRHFCLPTDGSLNDGKVGLGWSRSEATAKIRELTGDANFRYQIVFQATKGFKGIKGAERKAKPAEGEAAAPAEGEAAAA